jgi:hypothetical protein
MSQHEFLVMLIAVPIILLLFAALFFCADQGTKKYYRDSEKKNKNQDKQP